MAASRNAKTFDSDVQPQCLKLGCMKPVVRNHDPTFVRSLGKVLNEQFIHAHILMADCIPMVGLRVLMPGAPVMVQWLLLSPHSITYRYGSSPGPVGALIAA